MSEGLSISPAGLDVLMPMHAVVDGDCIIRSAGPTLRRLRPEGDIVGRRFDHVFEIRRPRRSDRGLPEEDGARLHLQFREGRPTALKGTLTRIGDCCLVNLGFGIGVVDAVRDYDLTGQDFAATDLTIEMLYLVEAKSAAMQESRALNDRLQRAKAAAEEQAQTDALTGAKNRRALTVELERLIAVGAQFTLMHLDLDFFKEINDTLGHAAGDFVLQSVAQILVEETRAGDTVARIGGDEFVLVLHRLTAPERVAMIARRIIERVSQPLHWEGMPCCVATSIGTTMTVFYQVPQLERMHRDADAALYQSKRRGRGRHTCASDTAEAMLLGERRATA